MIFVEAWLVLVNIVQNEHVDNNQYHLHHTTTFHFDIPLRLFCLIYRPLLRYYYYQPTFWLKMECNFLQINPFQDS